MEMFCKHLKKRATNIINYKRKEMIPLSIEESELYVDQEVCHIGKKRICYWY